MAGQTKRLGRGLTSLMGSSGEGTRLATQLDEPPPDERAFIFLADGDAEPVKMYRVATGGVDWELIEA